MKNTRKTIQAIQTCLLSLVLISGCYSQGSSKNAPARLSPVEILAQIESPGQNLEGEFIHLQWIYEELEGMPPHARGPQSIQTINNLWAENESPWRFHLSTRIEPGGLQIYDHGWDGRQLWSYSYSDNPHSAIFKIPEAREKPSAPFEVSLLINRDTNLLQQAQEAGNLLKEIEVDNIEPWGTVRTIAYEWDGATAATVLYSGYPHTILFKVVEDTHWLIEWSDVIHTNTGDVTHRRYQLLTWEELYSLPETVDPWTMTLPAGVNLVNAIPEPDLGTAIVEEPIRTILGWEVTDFGWTPWVPTYLPDGASLSRVVVLPQWENGHYHLAYDIGGNPSIVIDQALDLTYGWGNKPEIMELSWATVEIGQLDPMGPKGWVAMIQPHQVGEEHLPNINVLVELADKNVLLKIIESLQPANE